MCKYCDGSESIFYDRESEGIREVVVELDKTLSICSNDYDREDMKKSEAIGIPFDEAAKIAQYSISVKINYCPMCGRKLDETTNNKNTNKCANILDKNGKVLIIGDDVSLFGMIGHVTFECGSYGIAFNEIDWSLIESKIEEVTGCNNKPYFCYNDNYISFWELIWNFNCEDDVCHVVELINKN